MHIVHACIFISHFIVFHRHTLENKFERQIIEVFGRKKAKRPKQDDQNRLRSAMHK
jgi:hypothetical protein